MFTHLHLHTEYSLLDGACRIEQVILAAKALGQTAVAITDHGVMYGAVDFYKCAKKHGVKPIIGCEVYIAPGSRFDKVKTQGRSYHHLVLLCKNETGYQNLIKMVSSGFLDGFYNKPRIDRALLEEYHEGLICLSACLAGEIPQAILNDDYKKAKETALWYRDLFGADNFYLELQDHGIKEQKIVNDKLVDLSDETDIPLVATNDVHYVRQEDSRVQQVLICIQTNHVLGEDTGLEFHSQEFYLKSEAEMGLLFPAYARAISNTQVIAQQCNLEFEFGNTKLPYFEVPGDQDHFTYFHELCLKGFYRRYGEHPPAEYMDRLRYELETVHKMGYTDYYLIVADFIRYAQSKGIAVGPGRGSGAGSIAAYCIGITNIDPMKYNLLFERFLNPERISMPDFDIDFCYERRGEVIDYVIRKYGVDHVAQIVTFGTLAARAAIRDCGRAMGLAYASVDTVAKLIPNLLGMTIEKALKQSADLRKMAESNQEIGELIDMAQKVEGMPRNASTHAAGVVITHDPVCDYVPLAKNDDLVVTQYGMTTLEELGLLKMDFLGLRTLTVIEYASKGALRTDPAFEIEKIPLDDPAVMDLYSRGQTDGIFQFESPGMKRMLTELKPERLEDLIAATSLYRPGPAKQIDTYVANRHNKKGIRYKTPLLEKILEPTYGCMVYQEQVMEIFRSLAGYSYGRADIVRRAMSKKKADVMKREREYFIHGLVNADGSMECEGAIRRGIDEKAANAIFDEMLDFAKYAFNKSHAAAYALVAYQTAYLKVYFPCEFMAALLTSVLDNSNKVAKYIAESKRLGLTLSTPAVNTSLKGFTATGKTISYGLLGIKNLGSEFIKRIIEERQNGPYTELYDFCSRLQGREFNKRAVESLIRCGAMDSFGVSRRAMLQALPVIAGQLEADRRRNVEGQMGFFELTATDTEPVYTYPQVEEFHQTELLQMEKEITGLYLSGHPVDKYQPLIDSGRCAPVSELLEAGSDLHSRYRDNMIVNVIGVINHVTAKTVRNGGVMAFLTIEDTGGAIEAILFPKTLSAYQSLAEEGAVVMVTGKLSLEEEKEPKLLTERLLAADKISVSPTADKISVSPAAEKKRRRKGLFLRVASCEDVRLKQVQQLLAGADAGTTPLYYYYNDTKKYDPRPAQEFLTITPALLTKIYGIIGRENTAFVE